jgi:hypothetical protein
MKKIIRWVSRIFLAYCVTGLIYGSAGYLNRSIAGKEQVFSPWLGLPLDILGWPWMLYADLKHIGMQLQDLLALVSIGIAGVLIVKSVLHKKRPVEK